MKNQCIRVELPKKGELGQFANLRGWAWPKGGGGVFQWG